MCSYTFSHSSFQFVPNNNQGPETVINQGPETVILHILNPEEEDEMLQKLNCPKPADIIGIVIGIIGAIVGIGKLPIKGNVHELIPNFLPIVIGLVCFSYC